MPLGAVDVGAVADALMAPEPVAAPAEGAEGEAAPKLTAGQNSKKAQAKKDAAAAAKAAAKQALEDQWRLVLTKEAVAIDRPPFLGAAQGCPAGKAAALTAAARPQQLFDLYWGPSVRKKLQSSSNAYAAMIGAGSDDFYEGWKPFALWEIDRSLGFLI